MSRLCSRRLLCLCSLSLWVAGGCGGSLEEPAQRATDDAVASPAVAPAPRADCPARAPAPAAIPDSPEEQQSLSYWLELAGEDADRPLVGLKQLSAQRHALRLRPDGAPRPTDLERPPDTERWRRTLAERFAFMRERLASGEYKPNPPRLLELLANDPSTFEPRPELRVALAAVPLRCGPFPDDLRSTKGDPRFDRNACSVARAQEPVEVLGRFAGLRLARTRYSVGFIADDAPLSPPVPKPYDRAVRRGRRLQLLEPLEVAGQALAVGTLLPALPRRRALVATAQGFSPSGPLSEGRARSTHRPITRRALLTEAFRYVGADYGWGGQGGGTDCSRLVMDVLRSFGLEMPRVSSEQSLSGRYTVEVPAQASETDRLALLDAAHARGVVLLYFPGHIMLYLGRDRQGVPRALHAFGEYVAPCEGGGETLFELEKVRVTGLSLGAGSSRRSFLERLTRLTVLGAPPGFELLALSRFRDPAPLAAEVPVYCSDRQDVALFRSPRDPVLGDRVRVIAVSEQDTRPAGLILVGPDGRVHTPPAHELGVGPFGRWVELPGDARPGRWTALLADGDQILACERLLLRRRREPVGPAEQVPRAPDAPAWQATWKWEQDTENLYAAFVEQLFSHPVEDARTWSSLSELLRDPARNLLFDHRGLGEDTAITLEPDCADLPYFLRAYFSWKVGLPFGYRRCSRGRAGTPPSCDELIHNETPTPGADELEAFKRYVLRGVRPGVHSASGRTLPLAKRADLYAVPMTRRAIKPGSVFIDPYGHLIVVAKWLPQGLGASGMLLGADAQPDATVGRRRFWRGSFLFTPDTRDVGAGFKAFRPLARDAETGTLRAVDLAALRKSRVFARPSMEQYEGDADSWYQRMDALIYPRPLDPRERLLQLVDALFEQVTRRVNSVDNGERYLRAHPGPIPMPEGTEIFQTEGPWEDYSTPSRDMRLLIAIDTVRGLLSTLRAHPERFGVAPEAVAQTAERLQGVLDAELKKRVFQYTRSDGSAQRLSLADVLARATALEMAYNPNDCVERRWGAPEGSQEAATCRRHAPEEQRQRMARYRAWFRERARPAR